MKRLKDDFPIFANNSDLIYLDSASTLQKPQLVIDAVTDYLSTSYANIHRGKYMLSQQSEMLYEQARQAVADFIGANDASEVIFSSNSTDSTNLLARSLIRSGWIQSGDNIVLTDLEHHANLLPRQMLAEQTGAELRRVHIGMDGALDVEQVKSLIDNNTKILALSLCSNITGRVWEQEVKDLCKYVCPHPNPLPTASLGEGDIPPLVVVDASQTVVHMSLDVSDLGCDFCFFTGHKLGALTGTGVLWGKKSLLKKLTPGKVGGGAVAEVTSDTVAYIGTPDSFEPGTPNVVGAISLARAIEYIGGLVASSGKLTGIDAIAVIEQPLIEYCLESFRTLEDTGKIQLLGGYDMKDKIGVFSFVLLEGDLGALEQHMTELGIALRTGTHCAHIYHNGLIDGNSYKTLRISFWAYSEMEELERFFEILNRHFY